MIDTFSEATVAILKPQQTPATGTENNLSMTKKNTLLARQPIYDTKLRIYAYELLFRTDSDQPEKMLDGDSATSMVMLNAFSEIGIENLVAESKAFINFTKNLILSPPPFTNQENRYRSPGGYRTGT